MGWLAIAIYLGITIWVWTTFGAVAGIATGLAGFFALNIIGPRLDARYGDRSQRFVEFHQAWDSLIGPPDTLDALSAKRLWLADWRAATRETGVSAHDWIAGRLSEPPQ